jgi:hypothetical protein
MPQILDWAGVPPVVGMEDRTFDRTTNPAIGELYYPSGTGARRDETYLVAVYDGAQSLKWIHYQNSPDELFDLQDDPAEQRNLMESPVWEASGEDLRLLLARWQAGIGIEDSREPQDIPSHVREHLRALGYLQ